MNDFQPKVGDWRMTTLCLKAGQERRYGDTVNAYRVLFEWIPYKKRLPTERLEWEPTQWLESVVVPKLRCVYGWSEKGSEWHLPQLDYLKQLGPGLWEFAVREAYTD